MINRNHRAVKVGWLMSGPTCINSKILRYIVAVILWIWQLPQNLLGLAFFICLPNRRAGFYHMASIINPKKRIYVSLGRFIIYHYDGLYPSNESDLRGIKHEYGHCRQSLWLGPLYLLIIGLPSVTFWIHDYLENDWSNYYNRFPENWADKLGRVEQ